MGEKWCEIFTFVYFLWGMWWGAGSLYRACFGVLVCGCTRQLLSIKCLIVYT